MVKLLDAKRTPTTPKEKNDRAGVMTFSRQSNWVIAIVVLLIVGLIALPFVWVFTGLL